MALCTDREHPLHFAALGGHADAIACLLDAGVASIEVKDAFGNTPLLYAAMAASSTRAWVGVWMQKVCRCVRLHPQQVVRSCARCLPFRYPPPPSPAPTSFGNRCVGGARGETLRPRQRSGRNAVGGHGGRSW